MEGLIKQRSIRERAYFIDPDVANDTLLLDNGLRLDSMHRVTRIMSMLHIAEVFVWPYHECNHWILVVIVPKCNTVYYLDSLGDSENPQDLTHLQEFLDRYITIGGNRFDRQLPVQHEIVSPMIFKLMTREPLPAAELLAVRRFISNFFMKHYIKPG